eukprot:TRINITY_DN11689_c0_g1_i1.p1 TRINITY_DN11689_c0_g1~~TRINITY_DN11689_c0_g1_i1.p1  ORF type:complete len:344 (+),score=53.88 TRINITY_DN11689_c0_g1_i1:54-1085(+)
MTDHQPLKITFLGDLSVDQLLFGQGTAQVKKKAAGGGIFFGAIAAARLGVVCRVITKVADKDRPLFDTAFRQAGVNVTYVSSRLSTSCENFYPDPSNPENRKQRMLSLCDPYTENELEELFDALEDVQRPDVVIVNPLWLGVFPSSLLPLLRKLTCCRVLAVDAQGFLRQVDKITGAMHYPQCTKSPQYLDQFDFLRHIDFLKIDSNEANVLTGTYNLDIAMGILLSHVKRPRDDEPQYEASLNSIVGTESRGVLYGDSNGRFRYVKFGRYANEGRTGRGDTVTAAFLVSLGCDFIRRFPNFSQMPHPTVEAALRNAASITTQKMQYAGAFRGGKSFLLRSRL